MDHETPVLLEPLTAAVNCLVWDAARLAVAGPRVIETVGVSATTALAVLLRSARLPAVTVTFCALPIVAGAVYKPPLEIVPTRGLIDHETPVLLEPLTAAVNC